MTKKSNFVWLIDNGHGGVVNGKYVNAPAKMYKYDDGFKVEEGLFNRSVVQKIVYQLEKHGIEYHVLVPENEDISLKERKERIAEYYKKYNGRTILVSVHGNAGKGTGFEVFTTKNQTISDTVADYFFKAVLKEFPAQIMRPDMTDGDFDKEANFTILTCKGAAILTENFFMDRRADAELMKSDAGQTRIALAHVAAIQAIEKDFKNVEELQPEKNVLGVVDPEEKEPETTTKTETTEDEKTSTSEE